MATRTNVSTDLRVIKTPTDAEVTTERIEYLATLMSVAIDDVSALQEQGEAYREAACKIMAEALDKWGVRVVFDRDLDSIARVAKPVFIQRDSEKAVQENGAGFSEGFAEWNDALDEVTAEDVQRVTQIINERY